MSISAAKRYIEIAPVEQAIGGVLSVANVIDVPEGDHALLGAHYQTDACAEGGTWDEFCFSTDQTWCSGVTPTPPAAGYKDLDEQPSLVEGVPFAVYAGVECQQPGDPAPEGRARDRLGFVSNRWVDQNVWGAVSDGATAGTGGSIIEAVAEAEVLAGMQYGGVATLLVPKDLVVCGYSDDVFVWDPLDQVHKTHQGTLVANVSGVNADEILLTGRISLVRGPVLTTTVPETIRPDGTCDPKRALAERVYVPLWECMQYAIPATCN